jgi:hypothetical protein
MSIYNPTKFEQTFKIAEICSRSFRHAVIRQISPNHISQSGSQETAPAR